MDVSSARPDDLDDFSRRSHGADRDLESVLSELKGRYHEFVSENHWGVFEAGSLLGAFGRYLQGNDFSARWVAGIAAAFRHAGGDGALVRLPDRAIKASLRAAGLDHHRRSVTFDAPIAYGFPSTTGYTDDPINTATGNFVLLEEDVICGGLVDGLAFARTYNSRSHRIGEFGRGWASWATARLAPRPYGVEYVGPDGQEALFPRMGDTYGRVIGVDAVVEPLAAGLALCWRDGRRWEFDEAGLPRSVSRGPGTEIRLRHDDGRRLVELAHAGGKWVRVEWDADAERIAGLAYSDGRSVAYRYDEWDNLVEVDGGGGTRRYELDDDARVVSVVDGDGVVEAVNSYDADGRVLEQLSPFGRRTYISYLPGRVTVTTDDDEDGPVNTFIHDAAGRLLAVVDGNDQQQSMAYDEWGDRVSVSERNGAVTVQSYDDRSRLVRRILPTGAAYSFAYDDADRLVEVAVSAGGVTRYGYSGEERIPSEITDAEGGITRQVVRDGLVHRIVDPDGVTVEFEFDADGNVVAATDGEGGTVRYERDAAGRVTAVVTPLGRRTAYFYDSHGQLVERHDPGGAAWRYEYTPGGRLASVTDPCGAREETRYGEHGRPVATVDPLGHVTGREYDIFGNVLGVVEPDGARWRYAYDAVMRPIATIDPLGSRWEREYDVNGTLVATIDPVGVRVAASTDAFGRVIAIGDGLTEERFDLDELGRTVAERAADDTQARVEYDRRGLPTLVEDELGAVTRFEYTPAGRLARTVRPSGRVETLEYDPCGRLAALTDGAGRRWEYRYDADGAVVETELPTGEIERLAYDEVGRLTQRSAPGEGATSYGYDSAGRIVAIGDRDAGTRRFVYDAAGRVVESIDANGAVTQHAYDGRGRVTELTDPLGGIVTRRYDAVGRMLEAVDQLGRSTTMAYDRAGRLVEQVDASGRTARLSYDAAGRLRSVADGEREAVTIEYDVCGRVIAVDEPDSFSSTLRWDAAGRLVERSRGEMAMRWAYDADGLRAAIDYPDGTQTTYARDAGGYVVATRHPALGPIELRRDAAGRLVGANADGMCALWRYENGDLAEYEMHAGDRGNKARLTRDAAGRVVAAVVDGTSRTFAYDSAGQLVSVGSPEGMRSFSYDPNGRLAREISPAGEVDYDYDAAGQLLSRRGVDGTVTSYEYDAAGRRVRECGPDLDRAYAWDGFGRLTQVSRAVPGEGDPQAISVVVDALGELAALGGTPLLWDTAHPLQPLTWNGEAAVVGEGAPWALARAGAGQWLAPDWQGTIGDLPRDPWGAVDGAGDASAALRLGYRGELEFDGETWLRNRVYQPASRSFQQPDPFPPQPGTPWALNPYHYAANNPIAFSDPLGLHPVSEADLKALRDSTDRGLLDDAADIALGPARSLAAIAKGAARFFDAHATEISAGAAILACFPPLTPFAAGTLAGISLAAGTYSAGRAFVKGEVTHGIIETVTLVPGGGGLAKALTAKGLSKTADKAAGARLETWAGDFAKDRLTTQVAKQESVLQLKAGKEHAETVGHRLDQAAAVAAPANAWLLPHLMPHDEHHADAHEPHVEPRPPHKGGLQPLVPRPGR